MSKLKQYLSDIKSRNNESLADDEFQSLISAIYIDTFVYYLTPRLIVINHKTNRNKNRSSNKNRTFDSASIYNVQRYILDNKHNYINYNISNQLLFMNKFHKDNYSSLVSRSTYLDTFKKFDDVNENGSSFSYFFPKLSFDVFAKGINNIMNTNYTARYVKRLWKTILEFNIYYKERSKE